MFLLAGSGCLGRDLRLGLGGSLFLFPLQEGVVGLLLKGSSLSQTCLDNVHPAPFRAGVEKWTPCSFGRLWMKWLFGQMRLTPPAGLPQSPKDLILSLGLRLCVVLNDYCVSLVGYVFEFLLLYF